MRKLSLLVIGLAIAYYGFDIIADTAAIAPYVLRDGLIVALIGALIFVANTTAPPSIAAGARRAPRQTWPVLGQGLVAGAVGCAVMAAILLAVTPLPWLGVIFWGIGILLLVAGAAWPGSPQTYALPAYRWRVDAAGRFVRMALDRPSSEIVSPLSTKALLTLLALFAVVLLVGAFLRLWQLTALPPDCIGVECVRAMQLLETGTSGVATSVTTVAGDGFLYTLLTRLLFVVTAEPLSGLRWASALTGILTLPMFYVLARSFTAMGGAALATVLLACSPWHVWISRTDGAAAVAIFLICAAAAAGTQAISTHDRRWWGATGILLGLLAVESAPLRSAVLVWLLACAVLALTTGYWQHDDVFSLAAHAFVPLAGGLVVILPVMAAQPVLSDPLTSSLAGSAGGQTGGDPAGMAAMLTYLLHGGGVSGVDFFLVHGLIDPFVAALALAGLAYIIRHSERGHHALVLVGLAAAVTALFGAARRDTNAVALLPVLLPFLYIGSAVALDRTVGLFQQVWRPLVLPQRALTSALVLLLLVAGWRALTLTDDLGQVTDSVRTTVDSAIVRYLDECLSNAQTACTPNAQNPLFFVPPSVLTAPSARLLIGDALERGEVRALDPGQDLVPYTQEDSDRIYLVAIENQPLIDLLQQIYPTANIQAQPQESSGLPAPSLFVVFHVPYTDLTARAGLLGAYFTGTDFGGQHPESSRLGTRPPEEVSVILRTESLDFLWANSSLGQPPLPTPFSVEWTGSLLVPQTGDYTFHLMLQPDLAPGINAGARPDSTVISLQLDGQLVLDTSAALTQQTMPLVQGVYDISLRYRTDGELYNWAIHWQTPEAESTPIPRSALYSPALPNIGLVGTYHAGDQLQGPALTTRKDLILDGSADLPSPYSVVWRGKLAATRAGEYLFSVTGDGSIQLLLNEQEIVRYLPTPDITAGPDFSQASIYLNAGWHPIEIRYIPGDQSPNLRLLWQPPGSGSGLLLSRYLLPIQAPIFAADMPLPPAPALLDPRLGNDQFALSQTTSLHQPDNIFRPAGLPTLLAEQIWQTTPACGAGPEQLDRPHGLAVAPRAQTPSRWSGAPLPAAGQVYVADTDNRRIVILDLNRGLPVDTFVDARFEAPVDIEVGAGMDGNPRLWVLDAVAQTIFDVDLTTESATALPLPAGFYRPRGMAVDDAGNFLIADTGGARVALLNPAGDVLAQYGSMETMLGRNQPVDTIVANGVPWAITAEDGRLWHLESTGSLPVIERANTVDGAHAAALPDGTFFVTDPVRRTYFYHAASGQPLAQFAYPDTFRIPTGIAATLVEASDDASSTDGPDVSQSPRQLAVVLVADTESCAVSAWRMPLNNGVPDS